MDGRTRLRVGLVFGAFETAMPVIGLLLGRGLASALGLGRRLGARAGDQGEIIGGLVLIGVGAAIAAGIL